MNMTSEEFERQCIVFAKAAEKLSLDDLRLIANCMEAQTCHYVGNDEQNRKCAMIQSMWDRIRELRNAEHNLRTARDAHLALRRALR